MDPDVSVVIPTHNRAALVPRAIRSALSAMGEVSGEVVVVDDGSTDETPRVLADIDDSRVRTIRQKQSGAPAARNRGLEVVRGEYVKFLDDDDLLEPEALATEYQTAVKADAHLAAGTVMSQTVRDGETVCSRRHPPPPGPDPFVGLMSRRHTTHLLRFLCRRDLVTERPWREKLKLEQDLEYFIRISSYDVRYATVQRIVGYHRRHEGPRISDRHQGSRGVMTRLRLMTRLAEKLDNGELPSTHDRRVAACEGIWNELHHAATYGWSDDCERAWRTIERLHPNGRYQPRRDRSVLATLDRLLGPRSVERAMVPVRVLKRQGRKLVTGRQ